jgi:hypothetical protein
MTQLTALERLMEMAEADPQWKVIFPAAIQAIGAGITKYRGDKENSPMGEADRINAAIEVAAAVFLDSAESYKKGSFP